MNVIAEAAQQLAQLTRDTVLLLKGEGSNNQTNNVFIDSSSNNLSITRAGNVTQGSFTPFSRSEGTWGVAFNGTNDYMTVRHLLIFRLPVTILLKLGVTYPTTRILHSLIQQALAGLHRFLGSQEPAEFITVVELPGLLLFRLAAGSILHLQDKELF